MHYCYYDNQWCKLLLLAQDQQLHRISFVGKNNKIKMPEDYILSAKPFKDLRRQLDLYFLKKLEVFTVQLFMQGTEFQQQVWQALQQIPYGQTISYGELAHNIKSSKAARAVGAAANKNPFPIIVPCHRLIGSTGALVGFAGGLKVKQALLELEGVL